MQIKYENVIKTVGSDAKNFGFDTIILFGDNAPHTLKDFCYTIDIKPTYGKIQKGDFISIGDTKLEIIAVGEVAQENLIKLGHITINTTNNVEGLLPGSIVTKKEEIKDIKEGSVIKIFSESEV